MCKSLTTMVRLLFTTGIFIGSGTLYGPRGYGIYLK